MDQSLQPQPTPFYFLRHGETDENHADILQGQLDTCLGPTGRRQAQRAAASLSRCALSTIYTSPLDRAAETASIVSRATSAVAHPILGLLARNWGEHEGRSKFERPACDALEGGESREDFLERVAATLKSISGTEPFLIVSHSGVFRMIRDCIGLEDSRDCSVPHGLPVRFEPPAHPDGLWRMQTLAL